MTTAPFTLTPLHAGSSGAAMDFNGVVECHVYLIDPAKIQQFHEMYLTTIQPWLNSHGITQIWGGTVGNMLVYAAGGPPWDNLPAFQTLLQKGPTPSVQMLGGSVAQPVAPKPVASAPQGPQAVAKKNAG